LHTTTITHLSPSNNRAYEDLELNNLEGKNLMLCFKVINITSESEFYNQYYTQELELSLLIFIELYTSVTVEGILRSKEVEDIKNN